MIDEIRLSYEKKNQKHLIFIPRKVNPMLHLQKVNIKNYFLN